MKLEVSGRLGSRHLLLLLVMLHAGAPAALAQETAPRAPGSPEARNEAKPVPADEVPKEKTAAEQPPQFFESVSVSATLNPVMVKDTPGTVSVIDAATITRRMMANTADLVKFEPGVYVESNPTRIGLNGFNIRGIGGNRVLTQVDGVETSEQFDFGPFNIHQFSLDLDTLKSAEISRSAGSSLYGGDALGGVVSFFTKDPGDYLAGRRVHVGARAVFDGRSNDTGWNSVIAGGAARLQTSLFVSATRGHEVTTRGTHRSQNATRTAANPQNREGLQALGKVVFLPGRGHLFRLAAELADNNVETTGYSSRTATSLDVVSDDTMARRRLSADHTIENRFGLSQWRWDAYAQTSDTDQVVRELVASGAARLNRRGLITYDQTTFGGGLQGRKLLTPGGRNLLVTFGGSHKHDTFDMLRDRTDVNAVTGAIVPAVNLILPSKYFPKSAVGDTGAYAQSEIALGALTLVPGIRYDHFTLNAADDDRIYLATLSPAPEDFKADAVSARLGAAYSPVKTITLHAQYAGGFRAPPYSAVNSGFTNLLGGYTSVPNADLDAETSDNVEFGIRATGRRASVGVTGFRNTFDDFILQAQRGFNPATRLLEFQYQNISKARIQGVELRGEAMLSQTLRMRASYAVVRGDDVSAATPVPLNTVAPDQGAFGLQYNPTTNRWGLEATVRAARAQSQHTAGEGLYAPGAFAAADAFAWVTLPRSVTLRAAVLNLLDTKYFEWPNVRGRTATDPAIDRYSSPGVSATVSLAYGW